MPKSVGAWPRLDALSDRLFPWRKSIETLQGEVAALRGEIARLEAQSRDRDLAAADRLRLLAERNDSFVEATQQSLRDLAARHFALERLATASPAARPPGARAAVAQLGDPAVAVILPTYNRARFVGEAIASVQAQSFPGWELWVVDDGSTDDTAAAVQEFRADRRVNYIRKENGGSSSARNLGVRQSRAPLIAYLDSDNVWYPDFLTRAVDHFATHPDDDFVYGALVTFLHNLESSCILWREFERGPLERDNYIDTNVIMHRRTLFDRHGEWDFRLSCLNDWDIALRYTADKPGRALNVLAAFYRQCDGIRATDTRQQPREREIILAKLAARREETVATNS